jgi:hypothetical protein
MAIAAGVPTGIGQKKVTTDHVTEVAFLSTGTSVTQNATGFTVTAGSDQLSFPFDPNSLNFTYTLNKQTFDTYGGRVTQILSVKIDTMTILGDAGSRVNLMAFFTGYKQFQEAQIQSSSPLILTLPNSNLSFYVWLRGLDIGWDPSTTTNPYSLSLEVADSSYKSQSGATMGYSTLSNFITSTEIQNLFNGAGSNEIGYGNNGSTTLSAYYAGMAGIGRYTGDNITATNLTSIVTGLGSNPASAVVTGN